MLRRRPLAAALALLLAAPAAAGAATFSFNHGGSSLEPYRQIGQNERVKVHVYNLVPHSKWRLDIASGNTGSTCVTRTHYVAHVNRRGRLNYTASRHWCKGTVYRGTIKRAGSSTNLWSFRFCRPDPSLPSTVPQCNG
jgi:hypothetical protein